MYCPARDFYILDQKIHTIFGHPAKFILNNSPIKRRYTIACIHMIDNPPLSVDLFGVQHPGLWSAGTAMTPAWIVM